MPLMGIYTRVAERPNANTFPFSLFRALLRSGCGHVQSPNGVHNVSIGAGSVCDGDRQGVLVGDRPSVRWQQLLEASAALLAEVWRHVPDGAPLKIHISSVYPSLTTATERTRSRWRASRKRCWMGDWSSTMPCQVCGEGPGAARLWWGTACVCIRVCVCVCVSVEAYPSCRALVCFPRGVTRCAQRRMPSTW
jgi:hypothetical protein